MPKRLFASPVLIGICLSAAALSGCMSGDQPQPSLSLAPTESGFAMALPDSVDVLPQFASREGDSAGVQVASLEPQVATDAFPPEPQVDFTPAAYAGPELAGADLSGTEVRARSPELDALISKYAALYEVPEALVRRVAKRESTFNPKAYRSGNWGLMQIRHATARGMGYDGPAKGLLDAETNLKYAVKYLRGAYIVADKNFDVADRLYQTGYYYHAKRKGLLEATGLGKDRVRRRGT
ncbi:MAG: transglycosylase SLT domain-containing protein [Rhizobiaceae bacterium]